jgi:hypothetical protein
LAGGRSDFGVLARIPGDSVATRSASPSGEEGLLAAGIAGANVTFHYAPIPVPKTCFFTFVRAGERWLIDEALDEMSFSVS